MQAGHDGIAAVVAHGILVVVGADVDVVGTDFHCLVDVPVHTNSVALGLALIRLIGCSNQVAVFNLDVVKAVEDFPGTQLLILWLDRVELGTVKLVDTRLTGCLLYTSPSPRD